MKIFVARIAQFFTCFALVFVCLFNGTDSAGSAYQAEEPSNIRLNVAVVSDLHTAEDLKHDRNVILSQLFAGVSKSKTKLDAVVMPGDLTNNGNWKQYRNLAAIINRYNKANHLIASMGNHDARGAMDEEDYAQNIANYLTFCKLLNMPADKAYWSTEVEGYPFIVLGSEADVKDRAYISEEQITWLDAQLTAVEQKGNIAFIICHQVIDHTNNVDHWWYYDGSIGEQSDAVRDVIRKHTDNGLKVLFISGHLHRCFCDDSFEQPWTNLYCLNVATVQDDNVQVEGARPGAGEGCMLEVYSDRVLIRSRNFITGEWLPAVYTVPLG